MPASPPTLAEYSFLASTTGVTMTVLVAEDGDKWIKEITVNVPDSDTPASQLGWPGSGYNNNWRSIRVVAVSGGTIYTLRKDSGSTITLTATNGTAITPDEVLGQGSNSAFLDGNIHQYRSSAIEKIYGAQGSADTTTASTVNVTAPTGAILLEIEYISATVAGATLYINQGATVTTSAYDKKSGVVGDVLYLPAKEGKAFYMFTSTGTVTFKYRFMGYA